MITPQELRIGNIITCNTGKELKVVKLSETEVEVRPLKDPYKNDGPAGILNIDGYDPLIHIALTSEILTEKCGFLSDESGKHWIGDFILYPIGKGFDYDGKTLVTSVHHLQNLYYFTEGSELPVNF